MVIMNDKLTEVNHIPDGWESIPIGDIFIFKNGLNKSKEIFGTGTPIINYMDVYRNSGLKPEQIKRKVSLNKNEIKSYEVNKGDVFFTRTSETPEEIGLSSVLLDDISDGVFSGFILRARPINNILLDEYKKYCFSTKKVRDEIISKATFTTRALTNGRVLSKVSILVPPKEEQQKIATALSDMDDLIESLEKIIEKKKKIKQGTMQQLLTGEKRLPGFSGEWEIVKVDDFGSIVTGGTPATRIEEYWNGDIPWITPTDITNRKNILKTGRMITQKGIETINKLPAKTVLVTCIASIGKNAILMQEGACNQQINAIIPNDIYNSDFLYYLMENNKNYLKSKAGITATNIISKQTFSEIEFLVPNIKEQQAIAEILSDMDAEIEALEEKLKKYKKLKEGMMQELLTGRIRLV